MANIHTKFNSLLDIVCIKNTINNKRAENVEVDDVVISVDDTSYQYTLNMKIALKKKLIFLNVLKGYQNCIFSEKICFDDIKSHELARWLYNIIEKIGLQEKIRFDYYTTFEFTLSRFAKKCGEVIKDSFQEALQIIPEGKYKNGLQEILKYSNAASFITKSPRMMEKLFDDHAEFLKEKVIDFWALPENERKIDFVDDLEGFCVDSSTDPLI